MRKAKRRSWRAWALVSKDGAKIGIQSYRTMGLAIYMGKHEAVAEGLHYLRVIPVLITEVKK